MKAKFLIFICSFTTCMNLGFSNIVFAQRDQIDPMKEVEKDNCDKTVEVHYRSQKLTSPNGTITVYSEGILRRIGSQGNMKENNYCWLLKERQTPISNIILENNAESKSISFLPGNQYYLQINPITFSPNNQHLIFKIGIAYNGGDGEIVYVILDMKQNYKELPLNICQQSYGGFDYKGFISDSEVLFDCINENDEVVNLKTLSIRKVSENFADSIKTTKLYGTISGDTTILKRQVFPRR